MVRDFKYQNTAEIFFGKNALDNLKEELKKYGDKILLVYGGGSIKKNGIYDQVAAVLKASNKKVIELAGVMPNPTKDKMMEGAKLVKDNKIDLILALGGGSVIDCAKGISVSAYAKGDPFERYWVKFEPEVTEKTIPVGAILTMAGTGSEMDSGSVITDEERHLKMGRNLPDYVTPKFAILNPEFTYTVPHYQMLAGSFDTLSHLMEQYFADREDSPSLDIIEALIKNVIKALRIANTNPTDYAARSDLMWDSTLALNRMAGSGKQQDWEVHSIEHQLSAYTHCTHGMGLAVISVPYYRYVCQFYPARFARFAREVWGLKDEKATEQEMGLKGIEALANYIKELGIPTTLRELGTTEDMLPKIASSCLLGGGFKTLTREEILSILKAAY